MDQLRTRNADGAVEAQRVSHAADPSRLPGLIGEALAVTDVEARRALAGEINDVLVAMRAPGNEAAEHAALLTHLESAQLNALVDVKGRHCRKEAVETLLSLGFPYALDVNPADLDFARTHQDTVAGQVLQQWQRDLTNKWRGAAFFALLGNVPLAGMGLYMAFDPAQRVPGVLTLLGAAMANGSAWKLASGDIRPEDQAGPGVVHLFGALLGLLATSHFGWFGIAGVVASAIWAGIAFASQSERAGPDLSELNERWPD